AATRGNGIPPAPRALASGRAVRAAARARLPARTHGLRRRATARDADRHHGSGVRASRSLSPGRLQDQPAAGLRPRCIARGDRRARLRPAIPVVRAGAAPLVAADAARLRLRRGRRRRVLPVRSGPARRSWRAPRPSTPRTDRRDGRVVRWRNGACRMSADLQTLARTGLLRRADAALSDWISRAFPDSAPEVALAAALAARAVGEGHSALQLETAQTWLADLDGRDEAPALPDPATWQELLRQSDAVHSVTSASQMAECRPLALDPQGRVYLARYFGYERRLARDLVGRAQADRLALVTGGPGSGKTHGVVRMLTALAEEAHTQARALRIALAAPTGKAAARLAQSVRAQLPALALPETVAAMIPREATTLHRLLGMSPASLRAKFHRDAPLRFDVVVVDEVSMVDLPTMAKLVDAVAADARLVLLGDPDQLSRSKPVMCWARWWKPRAKRLCPAATRSWRTAIGWPKDPRCGSWRMRSCTAMRMRRLRSCRRTMESGSSMTRARRC